MTTEFDDQLKQRLLAFQQRHGLVTDGFAGTQTWHKLAEVAYGATAATVAPTPAATAGDAGAALMGAPVGAAKESTKPLAPWNR